MTASDLHRSITVALDGQDGHWDTAAVAAELWAAGHTDLDSIPEPDFWAAVARHELPTPAPGDAFRTELSATIARQTRTDRDAIWTDGTVTVRARGVSRVDQELPQPTAHFRIQAADTEIELPGDTGDWETVTWAALSAAVDQTRHDALAATAAAAARLRAASHQCTTADLEAARRHAARAEMIRDLATWMPVHAIAEATGLQPVTVYKIAGKKQRT